MGRIKPKQKFEMNAERIKETFPFFLWEVGRHQDRTPDSQVLRYNFKCLKSACNYWVANRDSFRREIPEHFESVNESIKTTIERLNAKS